MHFIWLESLMLIGIYSFFEYKDSVSTHGEL